ncbi:MAG: radical SAM family heme chaperone HemW [Elusimicrobiota bacterium]
MIGLYIHIPFCKKKCRYCDFVSFPGKHDLIPAYLEALYTELKRYSGQSLVSIYAGGGTPTLLSPGQVRELFGAIRNSFNCIHLSEITFEANPESLSEEKLGALKVEGVNRLSIGAQSFCERNLSYLGRIHTEDAVKKAVAAARKHHFSNIGLDLIYGVPGQTLPEWQADLKKAVSLKPEHISAYPLTIEPDTPLHSEGTEVDEDFQAELYEWTMDYLFSEGYQHYEISNWSLPGFKCRHNMIYWDNQEYMGVGAAAASYFKGVRRKNCGTIEEYISRAAAGKDISEESETIDPVTKISEEIILKLRCAGGVEVSEYIASRYGETINKFLEQKLLERRDKSVRLTKRGFILANQVMREFV